MATFGAAVTDAAICRIRRAAPADVPALIALFAAHARFERAAFAPGDRSAALQEALFDAAPRLHAWVAAQDDGGIAGYATATVDFATWTCASYLHMDCLFVRAGRRSGGIGARLLDAVLAFARERGLAQVQWQTPAWNADAARFYLRMGAQATAKLRFMRAVASESLATA